MFNLTGNQIKSFKVSRRHHLYLLNLCFFKNKRSQAWRESINCKTTGINRYKHL